MGESKGSMDGGESFTDQQDGWGGFPCESEAWDSPQRGSNEPTGEPTSESEAWDSPQREQDKPMGDSTGEPTDEPMSEHRFCSSCNQKKPLIDFGRFLTCNACRQRNRKANQARHLKQKALLNNKSSF